MSDTDAKEIAVRAHESGNSPRRDDREHQKDTGHEREAFVQIHVAHKEFDYENRKQRRPTDGTFRQESKSQRPVKNPPPFER